MNNHSAVRQAHPEFESAQRAQQTAITELLVSYRNYSSRRRSLAHARASGDCSTLAAQENAFIESQKAFRAARLHAGMAILAAGRAAATSLH
ncbi:MAG: hypothetical protein C0507_01335 [Cyanobacteria bacterium PR.3.49]|jgi:hypothetical protein|nr:hypothetical protein [Cyanobacteria bacterium PR.3.49]